MLCSFLQLSNIPLHGRTTLFTQPSAGERLGGFHFSAIMKNARNIYVQAVCGRRLTILQSTDLGAELLGHVVPLSSTVGGTDILSAEVTGVLPSHQQRTYETPVSLHPCQLLLFPPLKKLIQSS